MRTSKVFAIALATILCVCFAVYSSHAGNKTLILGWEKAVLEADLAGFELNYSSVAGEGTPEANWKPFPTAAASKIPFVAGQTKYTSTQSFTSPDGASTKYWFRVCAYDTSGNKSTWCYKDAAGKEAAITIDFSSPANVINFTVTVQSQ